jgi:proline iminopeptidase
MAERWVTARDDVRLWADEQGAGPAIVVPGAALIRDDLTPLCERFRVITYDIRNRGRSDSVPYEGQVGLPIELDDIDAIRQAFELATFSLIGWSYVGAIAALYAARRPAGLQKVVMICPIPPRPFPPNARSVSYEKRYNEAVATLDADRGGAEPADEQESLRIAKAHYDATTPLAMGDPLSYHHRKSDPSLFPNEWPVHMSHALERVFATFGVEDYDFRTVCANVMNPVLIVHGDADRMPLEGSNEWVSSFPDARLVRLPDVGHFPFVEAPDLLFPQVSAFLLKR